METREPGRCRLAHLHTAALVRHEFNPGFPRRQGELLAVSADKSKGISIAVLLPGPIDHVSAAEHHRLARTGENRLRDHRPRGIAVPGVPHLNANHNDVGRLQGGSRFRMCRLARFHPLPDLDRKSTRLNSSHVSISYAVFCLKKKTEA